MFEKESLRLAESVLSLSNFQLKKICKLAQDTNPEMDDFDVRNNKTMREALWSLGHEKIKSILENFDV